MKRIFTLTTCLLIFKLAFAQTSPTKFVTSLKEKKDRIITLQIFGGHKLTVEGYDGDELIAELTDAVSTATSSDAAGLKDITSLSTVSKSTRQPSVTPTIKEPADTTTAIGKITMSMMWNIGAGQDMVIKLPRKTHLSVSFMQTAVGSALSVSNFTNEVNINGEANTTIVSHLAGRTNITSLSRSAGKIIVSDMDWQDAPAGKDFRMGSNLTVMNRQGDIDITLPASLKANVSVGETTGKFYSDFDIVQRPGASTAISSIKLMGTINGGSTPAPIPTFIFIHTTSGNIYLRKKA